MGKPAILGGKPVFDRQLAFARPTIEEPSTVLGRIESALETGRLTDGALVRELEEEVAEKFGVAHCVAVSSCTAGLMLVIQALDPVGPVLAPSFTFSATASAVAWNDHSIVFGDCSPDTWCLRPEDVRETPSLIVGVHVSGVPCDVSGLEALADRIGAGLIFDSAHAAGSLTSINGVTRPMGSFGVAEVFSLTPTKVLSGAEGGLITTNDDELARHLRIARNYGNPGDYNTAFPGLNARLSELHAAVALSSLDHLEERVTARNSVAERYQSGLREIPGVSFQRVPEGTRSSFKDFTILIDPEEFGTSRDVLDAALDAEGIETRKYYSPPLHLQEAFSGTSPIELPVTERLADRVLTLPMWSHLPGADVDLVVEAILGIQTHVDAVEAAVGVQA